MQNVIWRAVRTDLEDQDFFDSKLEMENRMLSEPYSLTKAVQYDKIIVLVNKDFFLKFGSALHPGDIIQRAARLLYCNLQLAPHLHKMHSIILYYIFYIIKLT